MIDIKHNLATIEQQIFQACQQSERSAQDVRLLAVSKTKTSKLVEQAYQAGQREFGESYVQEAIEKIASLACLPNIIWHFIGPIQSNKTKLIAENFSWVHSIDRTKIAKRLNEHRSGQDTPLNVCLQVNISEEKSKSGVSLTELPQLIACIAQCQHLTLRGIMAIPEKNADKSTYKKMFELYTSLQSKQKSAKNTYKNFNIDTLSMGMSNDLFLAITGGSTMVRIGSAIFGQRNDLSHTTNTD